MFDLACWPPVNERFILKLSLVRFHSTQNRVIIENWENKKNFRTCAVKSRPCWAIIVKFDQIRKNWWRISCAEILEVGKNFFAASSVKKMSRFQEVSAEKIKRIAWKFTKTVILLGLAGYELIITNSAYGLVGYIYQLISGASSKNNC